MRFQPALQVKGRTTDNTAYEPTLPTSATRNYVANGLNQMTSVSTVSPSSTLQLEYEYGNTIADGTNRYSYDKENRLIALRSPTNPYPVLWDLSYDAQGRLYEISDGGTDKTRYLYDGVNLSPSMARIRRPRPGRPGQPSFPALWGLAL